MSLDFPHRENGAVEKMVRVSGEGRRLESLEGGSSPSARMAAELLKRVGKPLKCKGDDWYLYEEGKWFMVEEGKDAFLNLAWEVQNPGNRNPRRTNDILAAIKACHQIKLGEKFYGAINNGYEKGSYLLNFTNCVLRIDRNTGEILEQREHKSEDMFTYSLGKYVDVDCSFFKKILRQILPRISDRKLFLDFCASALLPDSRFEVALFCIGGGANGKSVITDAVVKAIGEEVCSHLTLHQICANERKHMWRLQHKLLNVATETDTAMITNTSLFKTLVSGESFETEKLYQVAGFTMQSFCKLCFLMNDTPKIRRASEADQRRIRFLYFSNHFREEDRDLQLRDKLVSERDGILSNLVNRLSHLCLMDEMSHGSLVSRRVENNFQGISDIVAMFYRQCLEITPYDTSRKSAISKSNLYNVFCKFCKGQGQDLTLGNSQFYRISKKLHPEIDWDHPIDRGKMGRGYCARGVRFTDAGNRLFDMLLY